jgi:2-oxoglutarate ferredoxin oxidoreductase subunit alpha
MILTDGALGQMMEKVVLPPAGSLPPPQFGWATTGKPDARERNVVTSLFIQPERMEQINLELQAKYRTIEEKEVRFEEISMKDAQIALVAFGLTSRICQKTIELGRAKGIRIGLIRPITLFPFPYAAIRSAADRVDAFLTVEMNAGQMVEDVRLAVEGKKPVHFTGRMGGMIPTPEEILAKVEAIMHHQPTNA